MLLFDRGNHNFGTLHEFIDLPNLIDATDLYRFPVPKGLRNLRLKEWQAFQLISDRFFVIGAVYNAKVMGLSQCVVYDRLNYRTYDFHMNTPAWEQHVARGLNNTSSRYMTRKNRMVIHNDVLHSHFTIDVKQLDFGLIGQGTFTADALSIYYPFEGNRGMYSTKIVMPFEGRLSLRDKEFPLSNAILIIDDHKGYYPRHMVYQWATGADYVNGALCAFNFTHNQLLDPDHHNENVVWYRDQIHHFESVTIERGYRHWRITDAHGFIDLDFHVHAHYENHRHFGPIKVDYVAPMGWYEGTIRLPDGHLIDVDRWFGMTEDINNKI